MVSDDIDRMSRNELKREVRRLRKLLEERTISDDDAELMQVGSGAMLAKAREQRDKYKAERDGLMSHIETIFERAGIHFADVNNQFEKWLDILNETASSQGVPHLVAVIVNALNALSQTYAQAFGNNREKAIALPSIKSTLEGDYSNVNIFAYSYARLLQAWELITAANHRAVGMSLAMQALGLADDVRFVADEIMRECRSVGAPRMETLQRLDMTWVAQHLPQPPTTHNKLHEGLGWAQQWKDSGKARVVFAGLTGEIADKTLRTYIGWYDVLDQTSRQTAKITDFLPTPHDEKR